MTKIRDWKMKRKKLFLCILGILGIVLTSCGTKEDKQQNTGTPDVVNSVISGTDQHLTVVANSDRIEDEEEFARTVVHMCIDNSFHSVRFSTDIRGYPSSLDIDVFLNCEDVEERKEPIYKVKFKTDSFNEDYDIKNHTEKFHLYLNDKEIDFY